MRTDRSDDGVARLRVWGLVLALAATLVVGAAVATPLLEWEAPMLGGLVRIAFANACHQDPGRSLTVAGDPPAVCARCSGLYVGGVLGLWFAALWWVRSPVSSRAWLLLLAPTAIDATLPWLGLPGLSAVPRALLASPAGFAAGLLVLRALADLLSRRPAVARSPALQGEP